VKTVLLVDDSGVVRRVVRRWLEQVCAQLRVLEAHDGARALELVRVEEVDLVLLDVEMPGMDGLATLRALRALGVGVPVLMFSTLTGPGTRVAVAALLAGATDVVAKPSAGAGERARSELVARVRELVCPSPTSLSRSAAQVERALPTHAVDPSSPQRSSRHSAPRPRARLRTQAPVEVRPREVVPRASAPIPAPRPQGAYQLVVVASSTGGPQALASFLGTLLPLGVPVACVQHMPPSFLPLLAQRLGEQLGVDVALASDGEHAIAGTVRLAPGGMHLEVVGDREGELTYRTSLAPPENSCRPAADVLFRSAARVGRAVAVVLTGMGADGALGARAVAEAGGLVLAQDAASAVVWGMPGAVAESGIASLLAPPEELARAVRRLIPVALGA